jgi:energy-converting hydrogenase Eha subunit G
VVPVADVLTPRAPRTRPWDAGPEATARDLTALRFVGEQYAARLDVLAVVLGRLSPGTVQNAGRLGERTVRQRVERWEVAGWAGRRRMLGHTWVLVTRVGLRLAGLEPGPVDAGP